MSDDLLSQLKLNGAIPRHVAVIMDGNGRRARERHLPRPLGHRAGMSAVREILEGAIEAGVPTFTPLPLVLGDGAPPPPLIADVPLLLGARIRRRGGAGGRPGVRVD